MTRRLITSKTLWGLHRAQGRTEEISAWAAANGLEPGAVSTDHDLTVEDGPDGRVIRCHVYATDDSGNKLRPQDGGPDTQERTVPLVVEPPPDWPVWALTDREERP